MRRLYNFFISLFSKNKTMLTDNEIAGIRKKILSIQKEVAGKDVNDRAVSALFKAFFHSLNPSLELLIDIENSQNEVIEQEKVKKLKDFRK